MIRLITPLGILHSSVEFMQWYCKCHFKCFLLEASSLCSWSSGKLVHYCWETGLCSSFHSNNTEDLSYFSSNTSGINKGHILWSFHHSSKVYFQLHLFFGTGFCRIIMSSFFGGEIQGKLFKTSVQQVYFGCFTYEDLFQI